MRLLRLELEAFRSHSELDLDLSTMSAAAIVGPNGAGKSSILAAVDYALTGGTASADELLSRGADRGGVTLTLEQAETQWRVNRGRERGKRSWLTVEEERGSKFTPLATRTMGEAQEIIDTRILGMDAESFRASVYAPQGQIGALAALAPGKRKELLGGLLGLGVYETWREKASQEARAARGAAETARVRLGDLETRLREEKLRQEDSGALKAEHAKAQTALEAAEAELGEAIEREKAVEQVRRREQLVAQLGDVKISAEVAKKREQARAGEERRVAELEPAVGQLAQLEEQKAAHDEKLAQREALERELTREVDALAACEIQVNAVSALADQAELKLVEARKPGARCPTCKQPVEGEHQAQAVAEIEANLQGHKDKLRTHALELGEIAERRDTARLRVNAAAISEFDLEAFEQAKTQVRERERAEGALEGLAGGETLATLRERWQSLKAEAEALPQEVPEGPNPEQVRERIGTLRSTLDALKERLRADEQARENAAKLEGERAELTKEAEASELDERAYSVLAKAFSRDGVPAMVIDSAVGAIEAAANEVLDQLGIEMSVRLSTQRQTKTGGIAETLDIVVSDGFIERELASYSGGEQARVSVALRLGLASVLSAGSGLELGCTLLDEVPDLDAQGLEMLADMLARLPGQVLLCSHNAEIVDAMAQKIIVERTVGAPSTVTVR